MPWLFSLTLLYHCIVYMFLKLPWILKSSLGIQRKPWLRKLPWWLKGWGIRLQCGKPRFDPWVGKIPWRRDWQPTPVFLPGEFHRQRSLAGYSPWGGRESDTTGRLSTHMIFFREKLPFLCNPEYFLSGKEQEKWKPRSFDLFSYSLNPSLSSSGRELVTFHILSIQ